MNSYAITRKASSIVYDTSEDRKLFGPRRLSRSKLNVIVSKPCIF